MIARLLSYGPIYFFGSLIALIMIGAGAMIAQIDTWREGTGAFILIIAAYMYAELTEKTYES